MMRVKASCAGRDHGQCGPSDARSARAHRSHPQRLAVRDVEARLGSVDILVNNAGVIRDALLHKMTLEQWRKVMGVDLDSLFNMTRPVIEGMRERGFGRIINMFSVNAQRGQAGQTNYCAAKAGILGFTRALALEKAGKGITDNAIAPGYIETDMVAGVAKRTAQ